MAAVAPGCTTLTQDQYDHFMEKGYIILHDCFTREQAAYWLKDVWVRLGLNPNDKESWHNPAVPEDPYGVKIHMPAQRTVKVSEFAPKAWGAICDLVGGEEKIVEETKYWRDNFIVNLGHRPTDRAPDIDDPRALENWHCDGDQFTHFLDSPDQGVVMTPIWSDEVKHLGGPTFLAPDSIDIVARFLHDHPEGFKPGSGVFVGRDIAQMCNDFVECVGKVGDVIICHPFMLHSASHNTLRIPRFITNPTVILKEPFRFDLPLEQLSPIERKTIKACGKDGPFKFEIVGERLRFHGQRYKYWNDSHEQELVRLNDYGTADHFIDNAGIIANDYRSAKEIIGR
ncbi:hypothetical protein AWJ20_1794 [Sugiyamaella lignohabitans]|uniref:Phytanoyl-CoA dioxygenase n=1 Tax=Sugiyamaella lignohabitans TaxID=796027 RepID=A0A167E0G2_9ASCO|nr:uncharacterized protein AWJ20_1794 [Sugiyamaella lignohabitans]ANB13500.1 hypothetical protein AWJ20_1794 [Sugiyamaella lignohabitans]